MNIHNFKRGINLYFKQVEPCKLNWVIYLLVHNDEIVYVGKSSYRGYTRRIKSHAKDKVFDTAYVAQVSDSERKALDIEASFISMLQPAYNIIGNTFDPVSVSNGLSKIGCKEKPINKQSITSRVVYYSFAASFVIAYSIHPQWCLFILLAFILYNLNGIDKETIKHFRQTQTA